MEITGFFVILLLNQAIAFPADDAVLFKPFPGLRYNYLEDSEGQIHLLDSWLKKRDIASAARYQPDVDNQYHLFTRANPTISQPLVVGNNGLVQRSNYNPSLWTVVLIHGWMSDAFTEFNTVLLPAFLEGEDCNVIIVDWSAGAGEIDTATPVLMLNSVRSGEAVARFLTWLFSAGGGSPSRLHVVGYSLAGNQAGVVGRNMNGTVAYVTSLDPAGLHYGEDHFRPSDAQYTEVMHTNAGVSAYLEPLGHVDFYPNGGVNMPGCNDNIICNHFRCYFYLAESVSGGTFTGRRCATYTDALNGNCNSDETLNMGGLRPKTGSTGIYYVETNASPPYARGTAGSSHISTMNLIILSSFLLLACKL